MSLKALFSELYVHRNDTPAEFKELPAFVELSGKPDIVAKVDSFGLPEVVKLICCSPELMKANFAEKYSSVQQIYCTGELEPASIIQHFGKSDALESKILKYANLSILNSLDAFFSDAQNRKDELTRRITNQKDEIKNAKKEKEIDVSALNAMEDQLNSDTVELGSIRKLLTSQKSNIEKVRLYKKHSEEDAVEKRREEAYRILSYIDREKQVDSTISEIVATGVVNQVQINQLRNPSFLRSALFYLSKEENKRKAIEILLKLYDIGAIDINESPVFDFITSNTDLVLDYLLGIAPSTVEDIESEELNVLVELALRLEDEHKSEDSHTKFYTFWNKLTKEFEWVWIFDKIKTIYAERFNDVAGNILRGLKGRSSRAYVNTLFASNGEYKVAAAEVFSKALSVSGCEETDSVVNILRLIEKNNHTMQVKLNSTERSLRSQSQELFSSVYIPLERLEELAINLSITSGHIKSALVGKQICDQLAELRGALETFNISPVGDIEDWKGLKGVAFEPEHHQLGVEVKKFPERVRLKSLGFSYVDDEGIQKERKAQVFFYNAPNPEPSNSPKGSSHGKSRKATRKKASGSKQSSNRKARRKK